MSEKPPVNRVESTSLKERTPEAQKSPQLVVLGIIKAFESSPREHGPLVDALWTARKAYTLPIRQLEDTKRQLVEVKRGVGRSPANMALKEVFELTVNSLSAQEFEYLGQLRSFDSAAQDSLGTEARKIWSEYMDGAYGELRIDWKVLPDSDSLRDWFTRQTEGEDD